MSARPPLGWSLSKLGPDVSTHLARANAISDVVTLIDSENLELRDGTLCSLMCMLERELARVERILESGHLQGGAK